MNHVHFRQDRRDGILQCNTCSHDVQPGTLWAAPHATLALLVSLMPAARPRARSVQTNLLRETNLTTAAHIGEFDRFGCPCNVRESAADSVNGPPHHVEGISHSALRFGINFAS